MSGLVQTTPPAAEPVTSAEAKAWLRVDSSDEDTLIGTLITAAREYVENYTRRALITQVWKLTLDQWPDSSRLQDGRVLEVRGGIYTGREIILPMPPLSAVGSVKYYDQAGALQTMSSSDYHVDTVAQPGRIVLNEDADWPSDIDGRPNAVEVAFTVGYGAAGSAVPAAIKVAMRYMIAHWFERRVPVNIGNIVNEIPETAKALLWQYRIPEAY